MTELLTALILLDTGISLASLWFIRHTLRDERARSDRYAASVLNIAGEHKAATSLLPPTPKIPATAEALVRNRQVGMTGR